jgi:RES domain-containing protein
VTIEARRIVRRHLASTAFTGLGAKLFAGRWNSPGIPAVYAGGSISLATREMLTHLGSAELLKHYVLIRVTFDSKLVEHFEPRTLPRRVGDEWVRSVRTPVLRVPSAVVPAESNFVFNPLSPAFARLSIGKPTPHPFDPRLK